MCPENSTSYDIEEYCPECENTIPITYDPTDTSFHVICPVCGHYLLLCSMGGAVCDWDEQTGCCMDRGKRMMTDRDKAIKGLESCQDCDGYTCRNFRPYNDWNEPENQATCTCRLVHDALTLLKAQEPRVMTLEEIYTLKPGASLWREVLYKRVQNGRQVWETMDELLVVCPDGTVYGMETYDDDITTMMPVWDDDYKERYWSAKPTRQQREATPWGK